VDPVDAITVRMQSDAKMFRDAVKGTFGALGGYVHVSPKQLHERFRRVARGEVLGFRRLITVEAFVRAAAQHEAARCLDQPPGVSVSGVPHPSRRPPIRFIKQSGRP
jgi:hypothetical protein